jgi:ketosteroid isomerase-like protein
MSCVRRFAAAAFLFVLVALLAGGSAWGQDLESLTTASREQLDVVKVLIAQRDAWNRGDINGFIQAYKDAPDTLMVTHQISHGFAELAESYRHDYPNHAAMGTLSFSGIEARALDAKFAIVLGNYHLERAKKEGGNAEGVFTMVLEKTAQGWKIILDHTT